MKSDKMRKMRCRILSVLISASTVALVYLLNIPNPMMMLIIPIVYFAYRDGYVGGVLSGSVAVLYSLCFFSNADRLFTYNEMNVYKVLTIVIAVAAIIALVGKLKARSDGHMRQIERLNDN